MLYNKRLKCSKDVFKCACYHFFDSKLSDCFIYARNDLGLAWRGFLHLTAYQRMTWWGSQKGEQVSTLGSASASPDEIPSANDFRYKVMIKLSVILNKTESVNKQDLSQ